MTMAKSFRYAKIVGDLASVLESRAKKEAREANAEYNLDHQWLLGMVQRGICQLTGQPLNIRKSALTEVTSTTPRLVRIDDTLGFTDGNTWFCGYYAKENLLNSVGDVISKAFDEKLDAMLERRERIRHQVQNEVAVKAHQEHQELIKHWRDNNISQHHRSLQAMIDQQEAFDSAADASLEQSRKPYITDAERQREREQKAKEQWLKEIDK